MQLNDTFMADTSSADSSRAGDMSSALMAAALSLASLAPFAAEPPDATLVSFKYLDYRDYSAEGSRMRVTQPLLYVHAPISETLSLEGAVVVDTMSGASPEYHNTLSGASGRGIHDERHAADLKLHRYFSRQKLALGIAGSTENDYDSRSLSGEWQWASDNQNTTLTLGLARTLDKIGSELDPKLAQQRDTSEYLFGVTQVLSPVAIVQSNLSYKASDGYHDDPYKAADRRPGGRHQLAWLTRYNHHFPASDITLNLDYRYMKDNWGVRAHTLGAALTLPIASDWRLRPSVRYGSQTAAYFYSDRFPPRRFGALYSVDYRLGGFGSATVGLKLSHDLDADTTIDISLERYAQRATWKWGGGGSPSLDQVQARSLTLGLSHWFR